MNHYHTEAFQQAMQVVANAYGESGDRRDAMITSKGGQRIRWHPLWCNQTARMKEIQACTQPVRFDLGPVYALPYRYAHGLGSDSYNHLEGRELVFDVDAKDYGTERRRLQGCACDAKPQICPTCWQVLLLPSARRLEQLVRRDLGCEHLQSFFSGRGGWHLWCTDLHLYQMDDQARRGIVQHVKRQTSIHLDEDVTSQMKHLLRAPLSMHQQTENLVVPLDMRTGNGGGFPVVGALDKEGVVLASFHAQNTMKDLYGVI